MDLVDLRERWQILVFKCVMSALRLSHFKSVAHHHEANFILDNAYELLQQEDEKAEIIKLKGLIDQMTYYQYGVNLITLRCLGPDFPKLLQFLDPHSHIALSPEEFRCLKVPSQEKLAILIGKEYLSNPLSTTEQQDLKNLIQEAQLKQGAAEYAKGLELIQSGCCDDMSLEKLQFLDEKRQKKLVTLIGKQALLKGLSPQDSLLMGSLMKLMRANQTRLQNGNPPRAALVLPKIPSAFFSRPPSVASTPQSQDSTNQQTQIVYNLSFSYQPI